MTDPPAPQVAPALPTGRVLPGGYRTAWLLMLAMTVSWLDRALPGILIEPMRLELHLSDTQVSLLTGLSFSICYGLVSFPVGWLADRGNRVMLLAASLVIWCGMTIGFGLASGFWLMFVFRMGVGLGEAAIVPAGLSLLADLFPRSQLPRASGLLQIGSPLGIMLALIGGSALTQWLDRSGTAAALGLSAWRLTFVAAGALGLVLAPFLLTMREPRRESVARAQPDEAASATSLLAYARESWRFLLPFLLGVGLFNLYVAGYLGWIAPYFQRSYGWSLAKTGAMAGIAVVATGLLGALLAGWLTARANRRSGDDVVMGAVFAATLLIAPLAILGPLAASADLAFAIVVAQLLLTFGAGAILPAAMVNAAPAHLRARFTALVVFLGALLGGALGPTAFALLTDHVLGGPQMLRWSLMLGSAIIFALLVPLWLLAWRTYPQAVVMARTHEPSA